MIFEPGHLYHIYNQGNNRQRIFFSRENYLFFLKKIEHHINPYADVLAWCLMPNHFHLMVHVNRVEMADATTTQGLTSSQTLSNQDKIQTLNQSIGIMLRSYTRAINIQENRSGSLFRKQTKTLCLTQNTKVAKAWYSHKGVISINMQHPEEQYPNTCFNYIHFNPVKDRLVSHCEDWEFSSYSDIIGLREGRLINRERINEFGLVLANC